MKTELLRWLVCPQCKNKFELISDKIDCDEIKEGFLKCKCKKEYRITNFIPRFVESDEYADSFSFQWRMHNKTQLDSANENTLSQDVFKMRVDSSLSDLKGKLVLDAGCGMGRYLEIAASNGAEVIGFDLSKAVDVAFENLGFKKNVHLIQADIFSLPFADCTFDFIYSFGVLHHTPDTKKAFIQLSKLLKVGGKISIFIYSSYNKALNYASDFWRSFTTRIPRKLLYYFCFISVPLYFLYKIPILGSFGKMVFPISMQPNWRWRTLDTFDWYSPRYQSKHTHAQVFQWFKDSGLEVIDIPHGEVSMVARKYKQP